MPNVEIKVSPDQMGLIRAESRYVLGDGGYGCGKSRALCVKAYMRASHKGAREALVRKHYTTLRATTLKTLLAGDGDVPPVIPAGSYDHNQAKKEIHLHGGGELVYFGLDDEGKIGSYNLSGCGIDEAAELIEPEYVALEGRIRVRHKLGNQLYSVSNPSTPSHFLVERFGLTGGYTARANHERVQMHPERSPWLPEDYLDSLRAMRGVSRARYFDGLWVGADGLVYDRWNRETHVRARPFGTPARVVVGVDAGYSNPFAVVRAEFDSDGRMWVAEVFYRTKTLLPEKIEAIRRLSDGAEAILVDPSAAELIASLIAVGIPARAADNSVLAGIDLVQARLADPGDGLPRLTVSPTCESLVREFESFEWQNGRNGPKDQPVKANDHALDALRYLTSYVDSGLRVRPGLVVISDRPGRKPTPTLTTVGYYEDRRRDPNWGFD